MNLVIDNLSKQYKNGTWGLQGLSLALGPGIVGLLGPAGAGKTTLLRLLATVMPLTEGNMIWDGKDVSKHTTAFQRVLGYVPQGLGLYTNLSGRAFLNYMASIKGISARALYTRKVMAQVGISDMADQKIGRYSNEQRRRVGLAQALLNKPQLLLIDEPGATLSPQERTDFCQLLARVLGGTDSGVGYSGDVGRLVIIATDDIADVASIVTSVVLLREGRLVLATTPAELICSAEGQVWSVTVEQTQWVELRRQYLVSRVVRQGNLVQLGIVSTTKPHPDAVSVEPTLSDAYAYHIYGKKTAVLS